MPRYDYQCDGECKKEYAEYRDAEDPQWVSVCDVCGGNFVAK